MIDFASLVLAPAMTVFGRPITVDPLKSQNGAPSYDARGVWMVKPIDVVMEDGSIMSSQTNRLGIRYADFAVPPVPGDKITVDGVTYLVDDTDDDGQGGTEITLKALK